MPLLDLINHFGGQSATKPLTPKPSTGPAPRASGIPKSLANPRAASRFPLPLLPPGTLPQPTSEQLARQALSTKGPAATGFHLDQGPTPEQIADPAGEFLKTAGTAVGPAYASFEKWAEAPNLPEQPIPAGTDMYGRPRIKMGEADHQNFDRWQRMKAASANPGYEGAGKIPGSGSQTIFDIYQHPSDAPPGDVLAPGESTFDHVKKTITAPAMELLQGINDANTRVSNGRKWRASDPGNPNEAPIIEYTTPKGNKFKSDQNVMYYDIGTRDPVTADQIQGTPDPTDPTKRIGGAKAVIEYLEPGDPRIKGALRNKQGDPYEYTYTLPNGTAGVPRQGVENSKFVYKAFPDGTITEYSDGRVPANMQNPYTRQTNSNGWGVRDPRAPTQDRSGTNFWEPGFKRDQWAIDEAPAYSMDLAMSSAPYMIDPTYALISGVAKSAPALMGYDSNSYAPVGRDFENLDRIGDGTYSAQPLTNAQSIGQVMSSLVDAAAEHYSGKAIGGIENKMPKWLAESGAGEATKKFLEDTALGRLASSFVTEGLEEAVVSPWDQLSQDSWKNWGRQRYWNNKTSAFEYVPGSQRLSQTPKAMVEDFTAGALMGVGLGAPHEARNSIHDAATSGRYRPLPAIPVAPRRSQNPSHPTN